MRTLGIDSALATTGYAVLDHDGSILTYGVIVTSPDVKRMKRQITGTEHFRRQSVLQVELTKVIENASHASSGSPSYDTYAVKLQVVVERTDWTRGARNSREQWIQETQARESLAIGASAVFAVCLALGIEPVIVGPHEWHAELGVGNKDAVAEWCAANWPERLKMREITNNRKNASWRFARACFDRQTDERVPDHVTDAAAMAAIVRMRSENEIVPRTNRSHRAVEDV